MNFVETNEIYEAGDEGKANHSSQKSMNFVKSPVIEKGSFHGIECASFSIGLANGSSCDFMNFVEIDEVCEAGRKQA